jgi:hypothetical protein
MARPGRRQGRQGRDGRRGVAVASAVAAALEEPWWLTCSAEDGTEWHGDYMGLPSGKQT